MTGLKDAVYGLAVGDALGVPFEFKKRGTFQVSSMYGYGAHFQPAGTWSDDTSMTIATADSIRQTGRIDSDDIMKRFRDWIDLEKYTASGVVFDYGITTANAIRMGKGLTDEYSNGNGSLMRIIPLAFVPDVTDEEIESVSALTHAHSISKTACVIYVHIIQELLKGTELMEAVRLCKPEGVFERLPVIHELPEEEIRSTGYVVDTLEAAVWSVATTESYKDAVLKAVNLGEDTDTVGAVAGGLAGVIYGMEAIPEEWIRELQNKELIDSCLWQGTLIREKEGGDSMQKEKLKPYLAEVIEKCVTSKSLRKHMISEALMTDRGAVALILTAKTIYSLMDTKKLLGLIAANTEDGVLSRELEEVMAWYQRVEEAAKGKSIREGYVYRVRIPLPEDETADIFIDCADYRTAFSVLNRQIERFKSKCPPRHLPNLGISVIKPVSSPSIWDIDDMEPVESDENFLGESPRLAVRMNSIERHPSMWDDRSGEIDFDENMEMTDLILYEREEEMPEVMERLKMEEIPMTNPFKRGTIVRCRDWLFGDTGVMEMFGVVACEPSKYVGSVYCWLEHRNNFIRIDDIDIFDMELASVEDMKASGVYGILKSASCLLRNDMDLEFISYYDKTKE